MTISGPPSPQSLVNPVVLTKAARAAWKAGDVAGYGSLNAQLHHAIVQIAKQETVGRLLAQLRSQSITFQYRAVMLPGRMSRSFAEHSELVKAIAAHDEAAAERAMREHLGAASDALHDSIAATRSAGTSGPITTGLPIVIVFNRC